MKQLTFIDFFSGIGGFRLGLEKAGMKCIGFCEKDKFAVKSYKAMYDTEGEWYGEDITKLRAEDIPRADIWTAGSPCSDISITGRRAGLHGDRSGLFFKFTELLKSKAEEDRPEWVICENVRGLLSSDKGWDFLEYLIEMDECGYDLQWQVFNSADYGVPQHRERVYTVGHLRRYGRRKILPICGENTAALNQVVGGMQGYRVYGTDGVSTTLVGNAGGVGAKTGLYLVDDNSKTFIDQSATEPKITDTARCITARYTAGITKRTALNSAVMETKTADEPHFKIRNCTKQGYDTAKVGDGVTLSYPTSTTKRGRVSHGVSQTLTVGGQLCTAKKCGRRRRLLPLGKSAERGLWYGTGRKSGYAD